MGGVSQRHTLGAGLQSAGILKADNLQTTTSIVRKGCARAAEGGRVVASQLNPLAPAKLSFQQALFNSQLLLFRSSEVSLLTCAGKHQKTLQSVGSCLHVGNLGGVPDARLWPGTAPGTVVTGGMNQPIEDLFLSIFFYFLSVGGWDPST